MYPRRRARRRHQQTFLNADASMVARAFNVIALAVHRFVAAPPRRSSTRCEAPPRCRRHAKGSKVRQRHGQVEPKPLQIGQRLKAEEPRKIKVAEHREHRGSVVGGAEHQPENLHEVHDDFEERLRHIRRRHPG